MYAVLCNPTFWNEINNVISLKGEEILVKDIDNDIDIISEFEKIGRISIKHLIIDISAIQDTKKLLRCIKRYRIKNDKTQIIIIAPNISPPDQLIYGLVTMGIYDIIAPKAERLEDMSLSPYLLEVLENPSTYKKAVRWFSDEEFENDEDDESVKEGDRIKEKVLQKDKFIEIEIEKVVEKIVEKEIIKTIKQQVITFYTTDDNLTKENTLTQIAVFLAKKTRQKILVIDMNTPTPTLDHLFGINKEIYVKDIYNANRIDTGISACYSALEKNIFSPDLLKEFVIPFNKNLDILTGIYDFDLIDKLEINHYESIIEASKDIYDTIIISVNPYWSNTATYTGIMKANKVLITCNANWTNSRNILSIVNKEYIENQKMARDKFKLIVTNIVSGSLDKDTMKKMFEEFEILGFLPYNKSFEKSFNDKKPYLLTSSNKKEILEYTAIANKLGYVAKPTLKDRLFKRKITKSFIEVGE